MQALVVVLDDQLPVRLHVVDDAVAEPEVLPCARRGTWRRAGPELLGERRGRSLQVEEDVPVPDRGVHAVQRVVGLAEVRHFVHVRRADQPSVEVVGPRVIRDTGCCRRTVPVASVADARAAMAADVVERAHLARGLRVTTMLWPSSSRTKYWPGLATSSDRPAQNHIRPNSPSSSALKQRGIGVVPGRQRRRALRHDIARLDRQRGVTHGCHP